MLQVHVLIFIFSVSKCSSVQPDLYLGLGVCSFISCRLFIVWPVDMACCQVNELNPQIPLFIQFVHKVQKEFLFSPIDIDM